MNIIPYGKQCIDKEDIDSVVKSLQSDYLTTGPAVSQFEDALCEKVGARFAIACANGTTALHLACMSLGITKKDICITSPITFLASANCVEYCGGKIDFVDIDQKTRCLSVSGIEEYCKRNPPPSVVIPVDFAGVPADLPKLWALAKKYKFKVIEDAAHSLGSTYTYRGKQYQCASCNHSDLAILSFHPVKTVTTGEGGAVLTNSETLAKKLRVLRTHGMIKDAATLINGEWYYEMREIGYNYRITDFQCALGLTQLKKLKDFKEKRQKIVNQYNKEFNNISAISIPPWPQNTSPCFHLYPIHIKGGMEIRKRVYEELKKCSILTQVHYIPVYWQPFYAEKYGFMRGLCPNAEKYYSGCLSLPLYPSMTQSDVNYVIKNFLKVVLENR
jgi:UDP-4-amino-4,6-dideoxy-N-acetyl-beta-L-altrosamine transaminase